MNKKTINGRREFLKKIGISGFAIMGTAAFPRMVSSNEAKEAIKDMAEQSAACPTCLCTCVSCTCSCPCPCDCWTPYGEAPNTGSEVATVFSTSYRSVSNYRVSYAWMNRWASLK